MALKKGTTLGPYEILSQLGAGGMGEVYLARDTRLGRRVAVKVLPEHISEDTDALMRFQYENKTVASLSHPNIRDLFDIGTEKGYAFAVMEYLEGETLGERLEREPMTWREAVRISLAVAHGLAAAHSKNIIHRDIKPHNIFLTKSGEIKILDFGLAAAENVGKAEEVSPDTTLTHDSFAPAFSGTISYMAPEQVRNQPADTRSDVFVFGIVLFEMLTSQRLFTRDTATETVAAILYEKAPILAESGIAVPEELQRVLNLCLEKNPSHRLQSMEDIISLLQEIGEETVFAKGHVHRASVAVLPFLNLSKDTEDAYFSDGLTEELINSLVKIGGLHVASRTTSALFKGKNQDIRLIGEQLNVRTIVEGSVRRSGSRLRVNAQLVNAADGYHLWSNTYDREVEDVFAVQSEIATHIARALQVVLTEKEKRAISRPPTKSIKAYDFLLQGRQYFYQFQRKEFERALSHFLHACKLDPKFAEAYAWASYCYAFLYSWFEASESNLSEADTTSIKALDLDPELAEAHVARGMALSLKNLPDEAEAEFKTALKQKPDLYEATYFYARNCFAQGQYEQAAKLASQATKQQPEDYSAPYLLGMILTDLKREDEAQAAYQLCLKRAEKRLELFPDDARALSYGGGALTHLNRKQQALEWAERAFAASPEEPMTLYAVACNFAMLGRPDKAVSCLERARLFGALPKKWLENDPDLDSLRDRPRFQAFLNQLKDE